MKVKISILGYYSDTSLDVFKSFRVPEGMNKELAIAEIIAECADLPLVYTNGQLMKNLIKNWTDSEYHIWERVYKDSHIEYNPIWNVDGEEKEVIERELKGSVKNENKANTVEQVVGYNESEWADSNKEDATAEARGEEDEKEKIVTTKTRGGNIGVTMTQQMLKADLDILPDLNPYRFIVKSFKKRFCILVY